MHGDRGYFYRRAEAEIDMAQKARCQEAVRVHRELASHYLDRAYGDGGVHADGVPTDPNPSH